MTAHGAVVIDRPGRPCEWRLDSYRRMLGRCLQLLRLMRLHAVAEDRDLAKLESGR